MGHIGILGVEKRGEEWYQFTLGGEPGGDRVALGERLGAAVAKAQVPQAVERILDVYLAHRRDGERFIDTYRRVGIAPFKERVYEGDQKPQRGSGPLAA